MRPNKRPRWMHKGRGDASGEPVKVERFEASPSHGEPEPDPAAWEAAEWKPKHPRLWSLRAGRDA